MHITLIPTLALRMRQMAIVASLLVALAAEAQHVEPLMGSMWRSQDAPFNKYCPIYREKYHVKVGCVATACESILTYHGGSITLADTLHGWRTDEYEVADVLPGQTLVCDDSDIDAVARLGFWCGVACHMNYGVSASGANIRRLVEPLQSAFGVAYVRHVDSYDYSAETWRAMLLHELEQGRPVLYAAYGTGLGGHAFVIDGMREDGLVHVNWGYEGHYDRYWYDLQELSFAVPQYDRHAEDFATGFFCNHEMLLLGRDPAAQNPYIADSLERSGQEVSVRGQLPPTGLIAGQYCPMTFTLRSTSTAPYSLTTPFELFSNEPELQDSLFEKGDYGVLFGATLAPGEERTFTIPVKFSTPGERILRLSPDDKTIVWESDPVTIHPAQSSSLTYDPLSVSFSGVDSTLTLTAALPTHHASGGTSGLRLEFCLLEGAHTEPVVNGDTRHQRYVYLAPGESHTYTADFCGLRPDTDYTIYVREGWTPLAAPLQVVHTPDASGINPALTHQSIGAAEEISLGPVNLRIQERSKHLLRHQR